MRPFLVMAVEEFLPDEDLPLSAEEEFGIAENSVAITEFSDPLDPNTFDDEEAVVTDETPPLGRGWSFDFGRRAFNSVEGRGPLETRGQATLRAWVEKCLNTQKGAHPIYSDDFGVAMPFGALGAAGGSFDSEDLEIELVDALTYHPRITDVTDVEVDFDEVNEALRVSFTVVQDDADDLVLDGLLLA